MTLLLTGCAGFIGSHVTAALLERGESVVGVDNLNDYYDPSWKQHNLDRLQHQSFSFNEIDIRDKAALNGLFEEHEFDAVVHLAARAGVRPSIQDPELYIDVNVNGTLALLELLRHHEVPRLVAASSSSVYGNQRKTPFSESDPCNEPISPYAASKKSLEMLCHTYAHLHSIQTTCLRFFTVYGPHGRPDMAPYLFTEAIFTGKEITKFGDGSSKRDYTYIDDIVSGVLGAIDNPKPFEIYNLGNNEPVTLNHFLELLQDIIGKEANIIQYPEQPGDVDLTYADINKAQRDLDYAPRTSFRDGLTEFVKWFREHRLDQKA
jgi:UDP-glucuronate 4-epimerase